MPPSPPRLSPPPKFYHFLLFSSFLTSSVASAASSPSPSSSSDPDSPAYTLSSFLANCLLLLITAAGLFYVLFGKLEWGKDAMTEMSRAAEAGRTKLKNRNDDSDSQVADDEYEEERALSGHHDSSLRGAGGNTCSFDDSPGAGGVGSVTFAAGLSRRQKKNRKINEAKITTRSSHTREHSSSPTGGGGNGNGDKSCGNNKKKRSENGSGSPYLDQLGMTEEEIYQRCFGLKLLEEYLRRLGFPAESSLHPGKAYIYRDPDFDQNFEDDYAVVGGEEDSPPPPDDNDHPTIATLRPSNSSYSLDANAKEFVPKTASPCPSRARRRSSRQVSDKEEGAEDDGEAALTTNSSSSTTADKSEKTNISEQKNTTPTTASSSSATISNSSSNNLLRPTAKEFVPSASCSVTTPTLLKTAQRNEGEREKESLFNNNNNSTEDTDPTSSDNSHSNLYSEQNRKKCARCKKFFYVTPAGEYLTKGSCTYHPEKSRSRKRKRPPIYPCCDEVEVRRGSGTGCETAHLHVWTGIESSGILGPFDDYVMTKQPKQHASVIQGVGAAANNSGFLSVYSLDCEMGFTAFGFELIRVTVIGLDNRVVYNSYVLPYSAIIDYNTRFSGVTAKDMERNNTKRLKEVQNDLKGFINAQTILIGHSLENDLRALKLIHRTVVDTSIVFPHNYGLPFKRSLKTLSKTYLGRDIQTSEAGHDSAEDATACMELILWKLHQDKRQQTTNTSNTFNA